MAPSASAPNGGGAVAKGNVLLGKYELGRLLGRGSFAKVYAARSVGDGAVVAIKVIDKSTTAADAAMEPRIVREVDAMRRLRHPNVLRLHEVMATRSKIYLVMELARGGDLLSKLARSGGRLPEPSARRYLQQLVSALNFCHQRGVTHRDVKPQNLLLDDRDNLKLSDFGLAAAAAASSPLHTACGTPAYAAPEVACRRAGGGYDGAKADAWSCGVMLFALLAGTLPFDDSNLPAMYQKIRRREFQIPAFVSKPARSIITRLLDPNPVSRMSIETLMGLSWFKKSLRLPSSDGVDSIEFSVQEKERGAAMNAFNIISMSSGLDLSGLFEAAGRRGRRFTAAGTAEAVGERVRGEGERQGYNVRGAKGGSVRMEKGWLVLVVEMWEMAPGMLVVEVKVAEGGGEFEELQWADLKAGLGDLVLQWHNLDGF